MWEKQILRWLKSSVAANAGKNEWERMNHREESREKTNRGKYDEA